MDLASKRLGLALALVVGLAASACASPEIPNDNTLADDSNSASSKKTPKKTSSDTSAEPEADPGTGNETTSTTPAPAPTTTPTPDTSSCTAQAPDACFDCCNQASGGSLGAADNIYGQCACGGGSCTAVCDANLCSTGEASAACQQCLTSTCQPQENAACTSAACKAGLACAQSCGQP